MVKYIVDIVDLGLINDKKYALMGEETVDRVNALLGKLNTIRRSQERGSAISVLSKKLSHLFVGQVEKFFKNLPNPLEWRSLLNRDLPLVTDFCEDIQGVSILHQFNRSQTRALY